MKTRQAKINFPKLNVLEKDIKEDKCPAKVQLKRDSSYECIIKPSSDDAKSVPKILIKKKKKSKVLKKKISNSNLDINNNLDSNILISNFLEKANDVKEIVNKEVIVNENCDPMLNKANMERISIKENRISSNEVSFLDFLDEIVTEKVKADNSLEFNEADGNESISLDDKNISNEIINEHLSILSRHCTEVNYFEIFYKFLSKLQINQNQCWNQMFSPKCLDYFVTSNISEVSKFKRWLEAWKRSESKSTSSRRASNSSDSDFEYTPDTDPVLKKKRAAFCVIIGPSGVGKTGMVYAIAKELNFTVLEMNCSSRRSGKDIFDKLNEAISNNHVNITSKLKTPPNIRPLISTNNKRKSSTKHNEPPKKLFKNVAPLKNQNTVMTIQTDSVMLFDDSDIIMEEDRGFFNSVQSIIDSKKRPVVLTYTDISEARKFIKKLPKVPHLIVKLDEIKPNMLACYLQTILLSRNQITSHEQIFSWLKTVTNSTFNIRSAINHLQFDSIIAGLDYRFIPEFCDWSQCQISQLSIEKSEHNDLKIRNVCYKSTKTLSNLCDILSCVDSYVLKSKTSHVKLPEKYSNIDAHVDSYYDRQHDLTTDINDTFITLYNSYQQHTLMQLDHDIAPYKLSALPSLTSPTNTTPHDVSQRKILSSNIRSVTLSDMDRCDRISALRIMAAAENVRKSKQQSRRFIHYFEKSYFDISPLDRAYLSTPFNK